MLPLQTLAKIWNWSVCNADVGKQTEFSRPLKKQRPHTLTPRPRRVFAGSVVHVLFVPKKAKAKEAGGWTTQRKTKRPSKYANRVLLVENLTRRGGKNPLPAKTLMWVLHSNHLQEAVAMGQVSRHWQLQK